MAPKQSSDWRDLLAGLSGTLPDGDDAHVAPSEPLGGTVTPSDTLTVSFERKGRGGKQATIISGFTCPDDEVREIASRLKQRLAAGGSARGGEILIQGDRRADVADFLKTLGFKVKGDIRASR